MEVFAELNMSVVDEMELDGLLGHRVVDESLPDCSIIPLNSISLHSLESGKVWCTLTFFPLFNLKIFSIYDCSTGKSPIWKVCVPVFGIPVCVLV